MLTGRMDKWIKQLAIAGAGAGFTASLVLAPVALAEQSKNNMRVQALPSKEQGVDVAYSQESSEGVMGVDTRTWSAETSPTGSTKTSHPPPSTNLAPVITGVSGPTDLAVNAVGKWSVSAYDPDGTYLSYSVDWGDVRALPMPMTGMPKKIQQTAEFSHQYSYAGVYTIVFRVTDSKGVETQARITTYVQDIRVAEPTVALSYDASSPEPHVVFPGEKQVGLVTYQISVDNGVFNLPSFNLNLLDTASAVDMGKVYVYSNGSLIGRGAFNAYGQAHIQLAVIIPNGTSQVWEVKADVSNLAQPGHRIAVGLSSLEFPTQAEFSFTKIPHGWSNPMTIVYDSPLLPAEPPFQKEPSSSKITAGFTQTIGFAKHVASKFLPVK